MFSLIYKKYVKNNYRKCFPKSNQTAKTIQQEYSQIKLLNRSTFKYYYLTGVLSNLIAQQEYSQI